jgi:hypothetical protein
LGGLWINKQEKRSLVITLLEVQLLTGLSLLDTQTLLKKGITEASNVPNLSDRKIKFKSILKLYQKPWLVRTW